MADNKRMEYLAKRSRELAIECPLNTFNHDMHKFSIEKYSHLPRWEKMVRSIADAVVNQKIYIGKTEQLNPQKRWNEHQADAKNPNRNHRALYKAINKYGVENFNFEVIEETDSPEEKEVYEKKYLERLISIAKRYNISVWTISPNILCIHAP